MGINWWKKSGSAYTLLPLSQTATLFRGGSNEGIFEIVQNLSYINGNEVFSQNAIYSNEVMYSVFDDRSRPYIQYTYDFLTRIYPPSESDERVTYWFNENIYSTMESDPKEVKKI